MKDGGILSTMTYYGSQRVVENYNIMGPVKAALDRRPAISLPSWARLTSLPQCSAR